MMKLTCIILNTDIKVINYHLNLFSCKNLKKQQTLKNKFYYLDRNFLRQPLEMNAQKLITNENNIIISMMLASVDLQAFPEHPIPLDSHHSLT